MKLNVGKLPLTILRKLVLRRGSRRREVVMGPAVGEDAAAIKFPGGYLVIATDPVTFTAAQAGWYALHVNANDVSVAGARPLYFQSCIILPPRSPSGLPLAIAGEIDRAARSLGVSVTGGHTEVSEAVRQPVVVGTMLGITKRLMSSAGARRGNLLVQIGPAGLEGSAILASQASPSLLGKLSLNDRLWLKRNQRRPPISVVDPALTAARLGATALHDATEGGIAAAIHEVAMASKCQLCVEVGQIALSPATTMLCQHYRLDPLTLLSSGTLLAVIPALQAARLLKTAQRRGWQANVIGRVAKGSGVKATLNGTPVDLDYPPCDALASLAQRHRVRKHPRARGRQPRKTTA